MFRDMIFRCSEAWYDSDDCPIKETISYIENRGMMRDAQVEAIKIYLFLKIACDNKPLAVLFLEGRFNMIDLEEEELRKSTREYLTQNPGAASLYEYCITSSASEDKFNPQKLLKILKDDPASIDYQKVFSDIFYGVTYSDYIFSLPMGAGKTYLIASFIYLDLYFASLNSDNPAFAHNFIVLAPSGLKTSIMPSLKTIERFDPSWILPDKIARTLAKKITFEPLESNSSPNKSNTAKNQNARKVNLYLRRSMWGVVFVTNAEKVILNRMVLETSQRTMYDDVLERNSNELRQLIGMIPRLSIFIDEVHHASDNSIKLRQAVNEWSRKGSVVSVIGFSGTPYLQKSEKIPIAKGIKYSSTEINNVVYYYPLIRGIGNFLKVPYVTQYENREEYTEIVENGLREFFSKSKDKVYPNNTCSKIAVYCNSIDELENEVYATAAGVCKEFGLDPLSSILKFHEDNKQYKLAPDAKMEFATLDLPQSKVRIVLLVQIGKEGWDCKSLSGVVLAKENKSTRNMVLQTCCRCLRQVVRNDKDEKAYIYLCTSNALLLESQLKEEQHITLKEFQQGTENPKTSIDLYNRSHRIDLPPIDFYQFLVRYSVISEEGLDVGANIRSIPLEDMRIVRQTVTKNFENRVVERSEEDIERGRENMDVATFETWVGGISKESFGFVSTGQLYEHAEELRKIYSAIVFVHDGTEYYSSKFDQPKIRSSIRKAFYAKRRLEVTSELIRNTCTLLVEVNFTKTKEVSDPERYYPDQDAVHKVKVDDSNGFEGRELMRRRYHYMPYHFDSNFELGVLQHIQEMSRINQSDLEIYYNGDRFLTDFHIKCYEKVGPRWSYVGQYTPDFIIVERRDDEIYKCLIIETKGQIYAQDKNFLKRKEFVEKYFLPENEKQFGYRKFDYLYLEDTLTETEQYDRLLVAINDFF